MYEELNETAKEYFLQLLSEDVKDETILSRCQSEIDILYERGILFVIESLYNYRQHNKSVCYQFDGIRNSLLMNILKLTDSDTSKPIQVDKDICVTFSNGISLEYVEWVEKLDCDYRVICGSSDEDYSKQYLYIPHYVVPNDMTFRINDFHLFETVEDYQQYEDKYVMVRLDDSFEDIEI